MLYNTKQLCEKIRQVFPDVGECGIDIKVDYDEKNKAWVEKGSSLSEDLPRA